MSDSYVDDVRALSYDAQYAAPNGQTEAQIAAAALNERGWVHTGLPARVYLLQHLNLKRQAVRLVAHASGLYDDAGQRDMPISHLDRVEYGVPPAGFGHPGCFPRLSREERADHEWEALAAE